MSSTSVCRSIDHLSLSNRAYQVLYALGDTSSTVWTLDPSEARQIVNVVSDIHSGHVNTVLDHLLVQKMSKGMLEYVAEGGI